MSTYTHKNSAGQFHREDGPAVENDRGEFVWYRNGVIHRDDGPAVRLVFPCGRVEEQFWLNGQQLAD